MLRTYNNWYVNHFVKGLESIVVEFMVFEQYIILGLCVKNKWIEENRLLSTMPRPTQ